jgi:hypothetical protein
LPTTAAVSNCANAADVISGHAQAHHLRTQVTDRHGRARTDRG